MLLAYETVEGASLDRVPEPWSDELLRGIWEQVALLRRERIAHRDLRRANLFVDTDGTPWVIDFGFSELAVDDDRLAQDVAQLLAALAIVIGPERAVDSAIGVIGKEAVGTALPFLQPPAFAGATRKALHEQKGLLDKLRDTVVDRTGTPEVHYEPLSRVKPRTALMLVFSLIALYVLIPQFANVAGMFKQLKDANWFLVAMCLVFSFVSYLGAALSMVAACPVPVRFGNSFEIGLAGSFVNRITPAGVGGIGLNLRFMQKAGANTTEAASRWGVNALAGGVVHITLTVMFFLWAGKQHAFDFKLPELPIIVGIAVVLVGSAVIFLVPTIRHKLIGPAERVALHAWDGVRGLAHEPARLALMFAGGALVTLGYLFALYAAVKAFGGTTPLAAVGAVYLAGSAIGQAAPTPGGLGAVEAVLIAGLVSVGLDKEIAVPAVLLFRLCTFWIPILPGWASFTAARSPRDDLSSAMSRPHSPLYWRTHLAILAGAALVFFLAYLEASRHAVPVWELNATDEINEAPAWIAHALWPIMQLGTVWAPIVIGVVVAAVYGPRRGAAVVISGLSAWFLAKFVKHLVERGRPLAYLPNINVREGSGGGLGFVSGHTAVAFAVATALLPILPPKGRVVAYALATMVGLARIVYGVHLVVDVIGGAALGIMCGCVVDLLFKVVPSRRPSGVASA